MSNIYKNDTLERMFVYGSGRTLGSGAGSEDRRVKKVKSGLTAENEFSALLERQMAVIARG